MNKGNGFTEERTQSYGYFNGENEWTWWKTVKLWGRIIRLPLQYVSNGVSIPQSPRQGCWLRLWECNGPWFWNLWHGRLGISWDGIELGLLVMTWKEVSRRREQSRLQTHFTCFWSVPKYIYIPHVQDFFGCHVNVAVLGCFRYFWVCLKIGSRTIHSWIDSWIIIFPIDSHCHHFFLHTV